jgi:ParB-like chromosome segregation protein Spo0J
MRGLDPKTMTVDQLVELFVEICIGQDDALLDDDLTKFRRLFEQMRAVLDELKSRPGDQRTALVPLYEHPNMQVRLKAAKNTLAVAPDEAQEVLEAIKASQWYPQAMEAGMCLRNLESGFFKPT